MNQFEGRDEVMKLLDPLHKEARYIDTDRPWWENKNDTLVFEIDWEDVMRYGADVVADTAHKVNTLIAEGNPDEFNTIRHGHGKTIYRLWWD